MEKIYYHPFCPKSRLLKIITNEYINNLESEKIDYWRDIERVRKIDPLGELPIIIHGNKAISGIYAICEFLKDSFPESHFIPNSIEELAEVRRLIYWINTRFHREVTAHFINEKLIKLTMLREDINTNSLRIARNNLYEHCRYFKTLIDNYGYLATEKISFADIFLASHVSIIDYFEEVNWDRIYWMKNWYATIKSRPSFREILKYRLSVFSPPKYYENPDF